jgi:hypothetical protein
MSAVESPTLITEPGVYDLPVEQYHADPVEGGSLSCSGARKLIPPSCPAKFRYAQDHPGEDHAPHFDLGSAAHKVVLGEGAEIVVVDADSWRTKAAQEQRDAAYAAGKTPLLTADYQTVCDMAEAIAADPIASRLFVPGKGKPEQTLIWQDERTGIMCRALLDWLPNVGRVFPDFKTAQSAWPEDFGRSADRYGYAQQASWYLDGVKALGLAGDDAAFVFVVQEKEPPYLVTPMQLDPLSMRIGAQRNRQALSIFQHCTETGVWPGYSDDVALVSLPNWVLATEGADL